MGKTSAGKGLKPLVQKKIAQLVPMRQQVNREKHHRFANIWDNEDCHVFV